MRDWTRFNSIPGTNYFPRVPYTNWHRDGCNRRRGQGQATVPTRPDGSRYWRIALLKAGWYQYSQSSCPNGARLSSSR